jgi:hypothetical protein
MDARPSAGLPSRNAGPAARLDQQRLQAVKVEGVAIEGLAGEPQPGKPVEKHLQRHLQLQPR